MLDASIESDSEKTILLSYFSLNRQFSQALTRLSNELQSDVIHIKDRDKTITLLLNISDVYEACRTAALEVEYAEHEPGDYQITVLGTSLVAGRLSLPMRQYILDNREDFNRVAFFTNQTSKDIEAVFSKMSELCGQDPVAVLAINEIEHETRECKKKIKKFAKEIKAACPVTVLGQV